MFRNRWYKRVNLNRVNFSSPLNHLGFSWGSTTPRNRTRVIVEQSQRKRRVLDVDPVVPATAASAASHRRTAKQVKMEIDQEKQQRRANNGQMDVDRVSSELTQEYCRRRETRVNEILQFSEYEQIDFVRTLMQHMSHHQLGVIDTTLQVLNF